MFNTKTIIADENKIDFISKPYTGIAYSDEAARVTYWTENKAYYVKYFTGEFYTVLKLYLEKFPDLVKEILFPLDTNENLKTSSYGFNGSKKDAIWNFTKEKLTFSQHGFEIDFYPNGGLYLNGSSIGDMKIYPYFIGKALLSDTGICEEIRYGRKHGISFNIKDPIDSVEYYVSNIRISKEIYDCCKKLFELEPWLENLSTEEFQKYVYFGSDFIKFSYKDKNGLLNRLSPDAIGKPLPAYRVISNSGKEHIIEHYYDGVLSSEEFIKNEINKRYVKSMSEGSYKSPNIILEPFLYTDKAVVDLSSIPYISFGLNNNYHYFNDYATNSILIDTEAPLNVKEDKLQQPQKKQPESKPQSTITENMKQATYRLTATRVSKGAKGLVLNLLKKKKFRGIEKVEAFLNSEFGDAFISVLIGSLLPLIKDKLPEKMQNQAEKLSSEFTVRGFTTVEDQLVDLVYKSLTMMPQEKIRVELEKDYVVEPDIEPETATIGNTPNFLGTK